MPNTIYIGTSLDGYIADRNGGLDFLGCVSVSEDDDLGFQAFMNSIDGVLMGRVTFDTVCGFEGPWPYSKPVFVLSDSLDEVPEPFKDKAEIASGPIIDVIN